MSEARSSAKIFVIGEGTQQLLLIDVTIDCPLCGAQRFQVAGHHLKLVRDICTEAIDAHPELTQGRYRTLGTTTIKGRANDPSTS